MNDYKTLWLNHFWPPFWASFTHCHRGPRASSQKTRSIWAPCRGLPWGGSRRVACSWRISQPCGYLGFCSVSLVVLVLLCRSEQLGKRQSLGNVPEQKAKQQSQLYQHSQGDVNLHWDGLNNPDLGQNEEVQTVSVNGNWTSAGHGNNQYADVCCSFKS